MIVPSNKDNKVSVPHSVANTVDRMSAQSSSHYSQDLLMASYDIPTVSHKALEHNDDPANCSNLDTACIGSSSQAITKNTHIHTIS